MKKSKRKIKVDLGEWNVGSSFDDVESAISLNVDKQNKTVEFSIDAGKIEKIAKKIEQQAIEAFLLTCDCGDTYVELTDTGLMFRSKTYGERHGMINRNIFIDFDHLDITTQHGLDGLKARATKWKNWIDQRVEYLSSLYEPEE